MSLEKTALSLVSQFTPLSFKRKGSGNNYDAEVSDAQECCASFNITMYPT